MEDSEKKEILDELSKPGTTIRVAPPFFQAKLKLRDIGREFVTYRVHEVVDGKVKPKEGSDMINLHHIQIDRICFPIDSDFNFDFMNRDLSTLEPSKDLTKDMIEKDMRKQADYRRFMEFDLVIR